MKEIKLTQGLVTFVDDDDFDKVNKYKWFARKSNGIYYASSYIGKWRTGKMTHMHNFIMGNKDGFMLDHIDRNSLNNQKHNLRYCTFSENSRNKNPWGASSYKGVSIVHHKNKKKYWRAYIGINGKNMYLGFFKTQEEAALAYNKAAIEYHGEFANINEIIIKQ